MEAENLNETENPALSKAAVCAPFFFAFLFKLKINYSKCCK